MLGVQYLYCVSVMMRGTCGISESYIRNFGRKTPKGRDRLHYRFRLNVFHLAELVLYVYQSLLSHWTSIYCPTNDACRVSDQ
jgi:hypothetical protein